MTPVEIACNHQDEDLRNCGAEAGEQCNWRDEKTGERCIIVGQFHAERELLADGFDADGNLVRESDGSSVDVAVEAVVDKEF